MANHTQEVKIKFSAETNAQSFKNLQNEISKIQDAWARMSDQNPMEPQMRKAKDSAVALEKAMTAAYNPKLSTYNLDVLNQKLKDSGTNLKAVLTDFSNVGARGTSAIMSTVNGLTSFNLQLNTTKTLFDKIGEGLMKTFSWSVYSSVVNNLSNGIQNAYGYVKALDSSLNDIRIVTGKSADEMDRFAEKANKAAIALGKGTKDYTNASLIYYQQGLSDTEVAARTNVTLKTANVTAQDTAAVSEQLTAVWNGYKVSAEETELYIDKLAKVAAETAADLEELSTGMSKVASAANLVGVDIDQMNAMLATTISVTRQSAESVGVAYKTILARMTTIQAGGEDEGTNLTSYTEKMYNLGINVLDANNKLRDMGDVIEEVGEKWQDMSREQQIALAQVMAGTRQYNNLTALFDNWDMYKKALEDSATAAGTLNEQQAIYMDSVSAHIQQLGTAAEGVYDSLLNADTINYFVDKLTVAVQWTEKLVDAFGGLKGVFATFAPIALNLFSTQMASNVTAFFDNLRVPGENIDQMKQALQQVQALKDTLTNEKFDFGKLGEANTVLEAQIQKLTAGSAGLISPQQVNAVSASINAYSKSVEEAAEQQQIFDKTAYDLEVQLKQLGIDFKKDLFDENYRTNIDQINVKLNKFREIISGIDPDMNGLNQALINIQAQNQNHEYDALIAKLDKIKQSAQTLSGRSQEKAIEEDINTLSNSIDIYQNKLETATGAYQGFNNATGEAEKNLEQLNKTTESMNMTAVISAFTKTATAMGMTINAGQSFLQTIDDISHGTGDLSANIAKLSFSFATLVTQFGRIKASMTALSVNALINAGQKSNLETIQAAGLNKSFQSLIQNRKLKQEAQLASNKSNSFAGVALQRQNEYYAILNDPNASQLDIDNAKKIAETSKAQSDYYAEMARNATMAQQSGSALLALAGTLANIVALVAIIAASAAAIYLSITDTSRALEKANEELNRAKDESSQISSNFDKFSESIEKLNEQKNALNELTKGTKEWNEQLKQIQDTVSNLIEEFPELRKYAQWENGGWNIDESQLENYQKELYQAQAVSKVSITQKEIDVLNAQWDAYAKKAQLTDIFHFNSLKPFGIDINSFYYDKNITKDSLNFNAANELYKDSMKEEEEIQKKINEAKIEGNKKEVEYWENILKMQEIKIRQDQEELNLSKQLIDLVQGNNISKLFTDRNGNQTNEQRIQEAYFTNRINSQAQSYLQQATIHFQNNDNRAELHETLKKRYAQLYGVSESEVEITDINKAGQLTVKIQSKDIKVDLSADSAAKEGAEVIAAEQISNLDMNEYYKGLIYGKNVSDIIYKSLQNNIELDKNNISLKQIETFSAKYTDDISKQFTDEYKSMLDNMNSHITSKSGKSLFDLMKISGKDLSLEEFDELSYAIQEVYAKKGPAAIEIFLEKLRTGKVEVKDFMDFDFDENKIASQLSEEVLERMKGLKIDSKDLDRYKIKFGLTAEDEVTDEVANRIMNYIEAQKDLNNIYKDRERIFENLNDRSDENKATDQWIEDMNLLSNAINTYFGVDVNDDTLLQYLDLIGKFLDGDKNAANELGDALRGVQNIENFENTKQKFINTFKDLNLEQGAALDEGIVTSLEADAKILNLSDQFDSIMESQGFIKEGNSWIYNPTIKIEPKTIEVKRQIDAPHEVLSIKDVDDMYRKGIESGYWTDQENFIKYLKSIYSEDKGYIIQQNDFGGITILRSVYETFKVEPLLPDEETYDEKSNQKVAKWNNENVTNNQIYAYFGFDNAQAAEEAGLIITRINGHTVASLTVQGILDIGMTVNESIDKGSQIYVGRVGVGQALFDVVKKQTGITYTSMESFEKDWELIDAGNGYKTYKQKWNFQIEGHVEDVSDAATDLDKGDTGNKEEVYTKKQEWKDVENKYDYNAQLQKDVDREMQQLKDEMQYMTGPALAQAYDTEIGFLEEKNRLLQESIDLKKEEQKENTSKLNELAAKYGVALEFDEKGRVTAESDKKMREARNRLGAANIERQNAADEAQNNISKTAKDAEKQQAKDEQTKAKEEGSDLSASWSEYTKLRDQAATYAADEEQATYEIYKNTKEITKLDISKMWAEADDKIKKCKDDIDAINDVLTELDKDSAYLDENGKLETARQKGVLRQEQAEDYQLQKKEIASGLQDFAKKYSDTISFAGFDFSKISDMDFYELTDFRKKAVDEKNKIMSDTTLSADERAAQVEVWDEIIKRITDARTVTSQYNDILRDTAVSANKVKDAIDQINIEAIDNQISKYQKDLDKLQDDASGLTGKKLIDNLNKQLAIQKKIVAEEKKKLPEYTKQRQVQESLLTGAKEWQQLGVQIKYNEDGSLANYYEIVAAIESIEGLNRETRDWLLSQLDALQKISQEYAKQEETIRKAEKTAKDTAKKIKDEVEKELGKAFEKLNAKVDIEVNIEDAWRQLHKLRAELEGLRDDDYLGNLNIQIKQLTEYLNTNPNSTLPGGSTQILTDHLNRIMSEINVMQAGGTSSLYGTDVKQAFSDLENYRNQVASNAEAVMSNIKEIKQTYLSAIDALISANDKYLSSLEKMNSVIKKVSDAIKLVYGDAAYDKIMGGIRAQLNNAVGMANASANQLAVIQQKIYSAPDEDSRRKWEDAFTNSVDKAIDYATQAIQAYDDALNTIIDKTQSDMLAFWEQPQNGQMPLSMQWDLELKDREDFYDYTNSLYETNTLRRKFQSEMSKVTDPAALEKLKNAQEEIVGYLDEQIKKNKQLTKYEVERANLLYELTLRQIALEEARDNKVKMRLRRDNAGNYRYEYVADETDIADKEQAVEETQNKLYNNAIDNAKDTVTSVKSAMTDMFDSIKDLSKQPLTPEEYDKAVKNYKQIYDERIKKIIGASGLSVEDIIKYGAGGNENFLNLFKQLQEGGLNFTGKDLTEISDQYEETYEGKHSLEQWIEANADNYLNTLQDISNHDAQIAIDIENQVNEMELQVQALQGIEEQLKSLVDNALSAYEQSLLYRNTDINADNANENTGDNANGLSLVQPTYGAIDGAGGTVDYYYDPATGKYYYDREFNNSAGSAYMEEKYGAERLNGRDTSNMSHRSVAYSSTYAERYMNETEKERTDRLQQDKKKEGEELTTLSNIGKEDKNDAAKKRIEAQQKAYDTAYTRFSDIASSIATEMTNTKKKYGTSAVLESGINGINKMLANIGATIESKDFNQNVTIDAKFDGKTKENEILGAFQRLVNDASQFAAGVTK